MKRNHTLLLALALTLPVITACGTSDPQTTDPSADSAVTTTAVTEHIHAAAEWDRDAANHWQICSCGEIVSDKQAHTTDEENRCTVCATVIDDYGDGYFYLNNHNENGDIYRTSAYNADGELTYEGVSDFSVDENGNIYESFSHTIEYENGYEYEVTFNQYEDIIARTFIDKNTNTTDHDRWEYEYNEDGDVMWEKQYRNDVLVSEITDYKVQSSESYSVRYPETMIDYHDDGTKFVITNGEWGMPVSETTYAADGSVITETTYVWEFDEEANALDKQVFTDGVLVSDEDYTYDDFGFTYMSKLTEYREDGTIYVAFYDEDGTSYHTLYGADGSVIEES